MRVKKLSSIKHYFNTKILAGLYFIILIYISLSTFDSVGLDNTGWKTGLFNGINASRGYGEIFDLPYSLLRLIFNKGLYLLIYFLKFMSNFSPEKYFGLIDYFSDTNKNISIIPFTLFPFLILGIRKTTILISKYFIKVTACLVFLFLLFALELRIFSYGIIIVYYLFIWNGVFINKKIGFIFLLLSLAEIIIFYL